MVDAFTDSPFKGNPAAVCLLEEERDEEWLQAVAREFNMPITCYLIRIAATESEDRDSAIGDLDPRFRLRWFTPVVEVNLCGHGTLAASHVLFTSGLIKANIIEFLSLSGVLTAKKIPGVEKSATSKFQNGDAEGNFYIELDFPTIPVNECDAMEIPSIPVTLNGAPMINIKKTASDDLIVELSSGKTVANLQPQFDEIQKCHGRAVYITGVAPEGSGFDFFSRVFGPKIGVNEVNAFTDSPFKGNPTAVCLLEEERDEEWLQAVAREFNMPVTSYLIRIASTESDHPGSAISDLNPRFRLRWFAPVSEVNLCGHATLAASHFLFTSGLVKANIIEFLTLSGVLTAKKIPGVEKLDTSKFQNGDAEGNIYIELDFPTIPINECDATEIPSIPVTLNGAPMINIKKTAAGDLIVELSSGKTVENLQPQFDEIRKCHGNAVFITGVAPEGSGFDFFSRFFWPKLGVNEVDAFTDSPFKGNPAAVCLLEEERDEEWLQAVAREFNVSETCYLTRIAATESEDRDSAIGDLNPRFRLRWFTPVAEVKLCGHATLAAAHVLFTSGLVKTDIIEFLTLSGVLTAKKIPGVEKLDTLKFQNGEAEGHFYIELDFPTIPLNECDATEIPSIPVTLNGAPVINIKKTASGDFLVELSSGKTVANLQPQFDEIQKCPGSGVIITGVAPEGSGFDFFSRFFCPKLGLNEDPVCGSAHCALAPYWSKKLGKHDLIAYQASPRGGILNLHLDEETQRLLIRGIAVTVMEGSLLA
ncbi:hypothetical protein HHK36_020666 [Tetracentron sinense]|uniref:Uncharacterized protein n=1 Tax=Tetracentron sinense TaxID=13715 RepID=A0A835D879_TETSI|nr:hypothetical protein HHK36_020666 [Tetracentron sinense]